MAAKVVVVTGASSGIGAALATLLAARGHTLALAARDGEKLAAVARACGGRAVAIPTDVTRRAEVDRLCDRAITEFGHVDVWINNVGRGITRSVLQLTDHDLDEMFLVNIRSALYGMQAIVPHFISRDAGHVINISSLLSRVPAATFRSAYSAAKAALNILTANLRMDLQQVSPRIHVSLVLPGPVASDGFQQNALGGTPTAPLRTLAPAQTREAVACIIADVINAPVPEVYTSAALADIARSYLEDPAGFERSFMDASTRSS